MAELELYNREGASVGKVTLEASVFEAPVKPHLMHAVVRWQLAKRRAGTASTKTRGEVRGGSRKPWRQKGTGRARHGSIRSPIWRKGGVVFGPKPRDWSFKLPRKLRRAALLSALSYKLAEGGIRVVEDLDLPEIKTKQVVSMLRWLGEDKVLIVVDAPNETLSKSARNVPGVKVLRVEGLNVYDVLNHGCLLFTEAALRRLQEEFGR